MTVSYEDVRPRFISIVAVVFALWGLVSIAFSAWALIAGFHSGFDAGMIFMPSIIFSLFLSFLAFGLWRLKRWSWWLLILISWCGVIGFPVGTLLFSGILVYFYRESVKILFDVTALGLLNDSKIKILREQKPGRLVIGLCWSGLLIGPMIILVVMIIIRF